MAHQRLGEGHRLGAALADDNLIARLDQRGDVICTGEPLHGVLEPMRRFQPRATKGSRPRGESRMTEITTAP